MNLIQHKTYRCVFCGLRLPGSKLAQHAQEHRIPMNNYRPEGK